LLIRLQVYFIESEDNKMKEKDIYDNEKVLKNEIIRLREFDYLVTVSKEIIGKNISDKTILDIGSGPNTDLGMWINKNGGIYTAFDKQRKFLNLQEKCGFETLQGDILSYEFEPLSFDITHTRFLLANMPTEKQSDIIRKILSISKERALFLEFDLNSFEGGGPVTSKFRDLLSESFGYKINPFLGDSLAQKINDIRLENGSRYYSCFKRFHRERGAYYHEIILLMNSKIAVMHALKHKLEKDAKELLKMIKLEAKKENPEKFVPLDIVAVTVFRTDCNKREFIKSSGHL
jgi:hypothetical protein